MKALNRKRLLICTVIPIISLFIFPPIKISSTGIPAYAMGLPIHFVWYRNYGGLLSNNFLSLALSELKKLQFDLMYYMLSVLVLYFIISLGSKLLKIVSEKNDYLKKCLSLRG